MHYTSTKFQNDISIFGVFIALYSRKCMTSFLTCDFYGFCISQMINKDVFIIPRKLWVRNIFFVQIISISSDLVWLDLDLTSIKSQFEWCHKVNHYLYLSTYRMPPPPPKKTYLTACLWLVFSVNFCDLALNL